MNLFSTSNYMTDLLQSVNMKRFVIDVKCQPFFEKQQVFNCGLTPRPTSIDLLELLA